MGDIFTIVERFGLKGIAFTIVGAMSIWGLAHWSAAPGQPVSVLWGLVEYTKPAEIQDSAPSRSSGSVDVGGASQPAASSETPASPTPSLPPLDVFLRHGLDGPAERQLRESLRIERRLRPLVPAEDGRDISELPSGTYFFTLSAWLDNDPGESFTRQLKGLDAWRVPEGDEWLEVHQLTAGGFHLLVCTDEVSAARAAHLSGATSTDIPTTATCQGNFTSLLSIPVDRVVRSRSRWVGPDLDRSVVVDLVLH